MPEQLVNIDSADRSEVWLGFDPARESDATAVFFGCGHVRRLAATGRDCATTVENWFCPICGDSILSTAP